MQILFMKKRVLALGLCVVMMFSVTACRSSGKVDKDSGNVGKVTNAKADMKGTDYKSQVVLPDYKNLTVGESAAEVSEESIKKVDCLFIASGNYKVNTENIGQKQGTISNYDIVNIDYVGTKDGVAFERGSDTNFNLGIGTGTFISGFEEGLIGVETGQTVDLSLTFPETYSDTELAGQNVIFKVTVNYIVEINDSFIKDNTDEIYYFMYQYFSAGKMLETAEEYYQMVKDNLKVVNIVSAKFQSIIDQAEIKDNAEELQAFINEQKEPYVEVAEQNGMELSDVLSYYFNAATEEEFDEYLTTIFHNYVTMLAIARAENLEVTEEEYTSLTQAIVDHSNGAYADIAAFQEDYPKQSTVDEILCGKVYHTVAGYIRIVSDEEAEQDTTAGEEETKDGAEETTAAEQD